MLIRSRYGAGAAAALCISCALPAVTTLARGTSNGLAYSTASASKVQRQPAAGSCHARGSGLYALPDAHCTPGALNPEVTQATIATTICKRGWTATVRPVESVTAPEKRASMAAYGYGTNTSRYEYDHLVSLELGGAVNDARNLFPERNYAQRDGFYLNPKDKLEGDLKRMVCAHTITLSEAQLLIAREWVVAYHRYVTPSA